jgi:predicted aspartyl protease
MRQGTTDASPIANVHRYALAFTLTLALGRSAFPHPPHPVEIAFEYSKAFGLMLIKVEVNGKAAVMVLDTGSNETLVSPTLVSGKPFKPTQAMPLAEGSGFSGAVLGASAFLSIGPVNPKEFRVLVMDLSALSKSLGQQIDGILGMSVLKEFEIVSVDLRHHKILLK